MLIKLRIDKLLKISIQQQISTYSQKKIKVCKKKLYIGNVCRCTSAIVPVNIMYIQILFHRSRENSSLKKQKKLHLSTKMLSYIKTSTII